MNVLSLAADAPRANYFEELCQRGRHGTRANFYPGNAKPRPNQEDRFAVHTDITLFTILTSDNTPGSLEVKTSRGEWVFADPVPNTLFVNLGDVMQRCTNDKWQATEHKVVWRENEIEDRISLIFFVNMNPDAHLECLSSFVPVGEKPKYEPIPYFEFISKKVAAFGAPLYK